MKTQKQKALNWWNKLPKLTQIDLALDYFSSEYLMDDDIEFIYLKEIPQENYTKEDILEVFNLGMEFRMKRLNGNDKITVEGVLNDFFESKLK